MANTKKAPKKAPLPFGRQTVLFHWMLAQLEAPAWEKLPISELNAAEREPWLTTPTPYAEALKHRLFPLHRLPNADIDRLDARVFAVTDKINERRGAEPIRWKYFQYLGLLFTELYLERYFTDREALAESLNSFLRIFNAERGLDLQPYGFDEETGADDLAKLAFWQATGSGKTLLLHAHFLQYKAALERHGLAAPDNVLLITPNAGLGRQHVREMELSGLRGGVFEKGAQLGLPFRKPDIHVIEITKFRAKPGPDTISPMLFEGNNLVFVDEGHRGGKMDGEWRRFRQELSAHGFCFEYSATFAQAAMKDADIRREYARSVVIDYAYKRFHGDGYGKHWRILNIKDDKNSRARLREEANTRAYLSGALTVLFQQLLVHSESTSLVNEHNLARPFCIFVGASVTGGSESKEEQTDILKVIEFLARFANPSERAENERLLQTLWDGNLGFQTKLGGDVFHPHDVFPELKSRSHTGPTLYLAVLHHVFNADAPGLLHAQELKEAQGELSLAVGENPPFAVVNVGDVAGVRKLCEDRRYANLIDIQEKGFKGSLFDDIDRPTSPLTILIGSRKFTEGWSSWRVSVMGLLNLGKTPGTQIIQLFGRGVRLLGKDRSLKRASQPRVNFADAGSEKSKLRVLETLSVFGIRADYMDQFEEELRADGAEAGESEDPLTITLPIVKLDPLPKLHVIQMPKVEFAASAERPVLEIDPKAGRVFLDAYPRVQFREDPGAAKAAVLGAARHSTQGPVPAFAFVNHRRLYADLIRQKNLRGWTNLSLPRTVATADGGEEPLTKRFLSVGGWYELQAPQRLLDISSLESLEYLEIWQQMASELVCTYADAFYRQRRQRYQTLNAKVIWLHELPEAERAQYFPPEYEVLIYPDEAGTGEALVRWIEALAEKVKKRQFDDKYAGLMVSLGAKQHLYNPLLHLPKGGKQALRVITRPTALNEGEYLFVKDLQSWLDTSPSMLASTEVFLLRNESRKGTGFFEIGGFYPDFMLWIIRETEQWLAFVDPKGLGRIADLKGWSKVRLWETLREIEARNPGLGVHLDSWLVSVTPRLQAPVELQDPAKSLGNHVVFQGEAGYVERLFTEVLGDIP